MRTPDDLPRRRRRERRSPTGTRRGRILIAVAAGAVLVLLFSLRGIARLYTDYLWFDSLGQSGVWRSLAGARIVLSLIFILLFFGIAWVNLFVADKLAPPFRPAGPEDELLERYHELVAGRMRWVRIGVAGFLALIAGAGAASEWNSWLLFVNGGDFGVNDPQFGWDVGFYVFKLPFLSFLIDWLFAAVLIIFIVTAVAHYLNGGIRVQAPPPRVTAQVKAHLSVLLAALSLIKTVDYWLQRFELTTSSRGVVDGATYTDVNAQLPALNLLMLISVAAAILFVVNIFRRGWTLPVVAVALWGFVAVVAGGVYPAYVQQFEVGPNESSKEEAFIQRNIDATRSALGVEGVSTMSYDPNTSSPSAVDLAGYEETLRNARLWDPASNISLPTYQQMQNVREYYRISDIDVDRYEIDGQLTSVGLGVRTINEDEVPIGGWEGSHLAYTHGYGAVLAPSGASSQGRLPDFLVRDVPETVDAEGLSLAQPRIYFGEGQSGYAVVGTDRDEIDYVSQDEEEGDGGVISENYAGADGVAAGSFLRQLAFSLRFGDVNPLISDFMTGDSKVLYNRDIGERVAELAPFLHQDNDPYPVLLEDRVVWVVDLYTTTDQYPYSQEANVDELAPESGLSHGFNYVRNSVKATVDAYDGTVNFYVMDEEDPILGAYRDAFPDLFSDRGDMPEGLDEHLRYPEDMFRVQTGAWQRYHIGDANAFYGQSDQWVVARDPDTASGGEATTVTDESGDVIAIRDARIPPYYQLMQLPAASEEGENEDGEGSEGGESEGEDDSEDGESGGGGGSEEGQTAPPSELEYTLSRPFVPFSQDDSNQLLAGIMVARMDPENYGELVVYELPSNDRPDGPGIVASNIFSNREVSGLQSQLGGGNSAVLFGNLLTLPVDDALLYVQPFYVEPDSPRRPRLNCVITAFGDRVEIAPTLQESLQEMFGDRIETAEEAEAEQSSAEESCEITGVGATGEVEEGEEETPDTTEPETTEPDTTDTTEGPPLEGTPEEQAQQLLNEANTLFEEANTALEDGDLGTYQEKVQEAETKTAEALDLLENTDDEGRPA